MSKKKVQSEVSRSLKPFAEIAALLGSVVGDLQRYEPDQIEEGEFSLLIDDVREALWQMFRLYEELFG